MFTPFASDLLWLPALIALASAAVFAGTLRRRPPERRIGSHDFMATHPAMEPVLAGAIDVAAEVRTVLGRLDAVTGRMLVKFTVAIQPGLLAHAEPAMFRQVLSDLLNRAIDRAPCGNVLLVATQQGGRVAISVSDDGDVAGHNVTEASLRGASQLTALQGGTLDIDTRPGEGTITTVRLATPVADGAVAVDEITAAPIAVGI